MSQPHGEEKDGEEERGEGDALPAEGRGGRAGARRAGVQQEGTSPAASFFISLAVLIGKLNLVITSWQGALLAPACCHGV